jgi:hypothetical protein
MLNKNCSLLFRLAFILSVFFAESVFAQDKAWQNIRTTEEVWENYPDKLRTLISEVDLNRKDLDEVKTFTADGDTVAAVKSLLAHFRKSKEGRWLVYEPVNEIPEMSAVVARQLLSDTVTLREQTVRVPLTGSGGWNWHFTGPKGDDEFGYNLNRHRYLLALLDAHKLDASEKYAEKFDSIIRDWAIHNPVPPAGDSIYMVLASTTLDWRDIGEVVWRDLEAGNRLEDCWPQLFYGFQNSAGFSEAGRIFMLCSIFEQSEYLKQYHKRGHNWTTMEMNGLALVGLTFPEFKNAEKWADYAMGVMEQEINRQVYPDGVQTELSTKTQWVALKPFETIAVNFEISGRKVKPAYIDRVIKMYDYLAYCMRPDGHQPLNNDSDREDLRPRVLAAAKKYSRPDWEWIATNGVAGTIPKGSPTVVFPWAGLHIMRNGWDKNAHWALFDTGPFGTGHQHSDMLHLSVAAFGKDLLVDGGRFTHQDYFSFDPTIWRGYFRSSFSHNVILIDGKGQKNGKLRASSPLVQGVDYLNTDEFDFARGTFSDGFQGISGSVQHSRSMVYVKNKFWVVLDHVSTDSPREIQALWHYAPSCVVKTEGGRTFTTNMNEGNLEIIALSAPNWDIRLVKGQEKPFIQGWYSEDYGRKEPNVAAVYTGKIARETNFAWVIVPFFGKRSKVTATVLKQNSDYMEVKVQMEGRKPIIVKMPVKTGLPEVN